MRRNLILAIAIFVVAIFGAQSVSAQITIKIPEVKDLLKKKKKDEPKTEPQKTEQTKADNSSDNGSSSSSSSAVNPEQIGKFYFSDKPFGATRGATRTEFSSKETIYGRYEVDRPFNEVFGFKNADPKDQEFEIRMMVTDLGSLETIMIRNASPKYDTNSNFEFTCLLASADLEKNYINFAVRSALDGKQPFQCGETENGLGTMIADRVYFRISYGEGSDEDKSLYKSGKYAIIVGIRTTPIDFRGYSDRNDKKGGFGSFYLNFDQADYAAAKAGVAKAKTLAEAAKEAAAKKARAEQREANLIRKLPAVFTNPGIYPGFTPAKLKAMLYEDDPRIKPMKIAMEKVSNAGWYIAKNAFGLPEYQYFSARMYAIYEADPDRCIVADYQIGKSYLGGGRYGGAYLRSGGTVGEIDCSLGKK